MKVTVPADVSTWQHTLTEWQREHLVVAARGQTRSGEGSHHRLVIVREEYGFDVIGVRRVACFDSHGAPVEDAWAISWVQEVHPTSVNHGDWKHRYDTPRLHPRPYDGMGEGRWGMKLRRRNRRFRRNEARRHARQQRDMRAELARLEAELAEWVGSPYTYPNYDKIAELQSLLQEETTTHG